MKHTNIEIFLENVIIFKFKEEIVSNLIVKYFARILITKKKKVSLRAQGIFAERKILGNCSNWSQISKTDIMKNCTVPLLL